MDWGTACIIFATAWLIIITGTIIVLIEETRVKQLARQLEAARHDALATLKDAWLEALEKSGPNLFQNEAEVEAKLVAPLIRFLGYGEKDFRLRVQVKFQVGRGEASGVADWVIYRNGRPFLVVETKAPGQALNEQVENQARSYAFQLGAPYYILTNGRHLKLYELKIGEDRRLLEANVNELRGKWADIVNLLGGINR